MHVLYGQTGHQGLQMKVEHEEAKKDKIKKE
jgi:hypothetical protein